MMLSAKCVLLFSIVFYAFNFIDSADSAKGSCRTTTGKNGICKVLHKCNFATELSKKRGHLYQQYINYLKNNRCGFQNNNPKICCPNVKVKKPRYETFVHEKPSSTNSKKQAQKIKPVNTTKKPRTKNPPSLLPDKCGKKFDTRILGGESTQINEFPWLALLEYEKSSETILGCSGSLISKRYILTAGHCVSSLPENWQLKRVRLGEYDTQSELDCEPEGDDGLKCADTVLMLSIEQEIVHESFWTPNYANDIALLRLSQDVPISDYIQPICLPKSSDLGDIYWAAGWGETTFKTRSSVKLKVTLPRFDFDKCKNIYATKNVPLTEGQICAGGESGKDTCAGDSGGPLMRLVGGNWIMDGIISMGHKPCGANGWPAVYTKVFHYLPWIIKKLQP